MTDETNDKQVAAFGQGLYATDAMDSVPISPLGRIAGAEYRSALFDELAKDDAAHEGREIPPRIFEIIRRAFVRAHAGEFKT